MVRNFLVPGMAWLVAAGSTDAGTVPGDGRSLRAAAEEMMAETGARGLAVATVRGDHSAAQLTVLGDRNEAGEPLTETTVMYGASLTKTAFAYLVLMLVDEGILDLDTPIGEILPEALPSYEGFAETHAPYETLAGEERWRMITPRHLLTHAAGFRNFYFITPDYRFDRSAPLQIHFDPGARYMYSGDGFILLQFVLEQGLGIDVGRAMRERIFEPLGMTRTDVIWRDDFATDLADGWNLRGEPVAHDDRSKVRMAGSMDTTIADQARLWRAIVSCRGLSEAACTEFFAPQMEITTASQFPNFQKELPPGERHPNLFAGLGLIVTEGPQGKVVFKGGHDEHTGNMAVCLVEKAECVVILSNDVRSEPGFAKIVEAALGDTGVPWRWEYNMFEMID